MEKPGPINPHKVIVKYNYLFLFFSMKYLLKSMLVISLMLSACKTGGTNTDAQKAIMTVLDKQVQGWNNGNIDDYMHGYWQNDSLLFIGSSGPTYGYDNAAARYKKAYPDKEHMGTLSFADVEMKRLSDNHYFVNGKWKLDRTEDTLSGYFTLLFEKVNDKWVIVADHSS